MIDTDFDQASRIHRNGGAVVDGKTDEQKSREERVQNTPATREAVRYLGEQAHQNGLPITDVPNYGFEQLRACWRLGWKRAEARKGISPTPEPTEKVICKRCGNDLAYHYSGNPYCDLAMGEVERAAESPKPAQPLAPQEEPAQPEATWVPVYVERAICDLIPDVGYAREIARKAWAWDDEHVGYENALYKWQNEAIRQRRDLIALQAQMEMEAEPAQPDPKDARIAELEDTLCWVLRDLREWCEAVSYNSTWDSWDSYYKSFQYGGLDKAEAALAAKEQV